eukprot:gene11917-2483_t
MASSWLFLLLGIELIAFTTAFFFELSDRSHVERCFHEEYDSGMTIAGTYRIQDHEDGNENFIPGSVQLRVIDPDRHDMLQKEYKGEGTFAFATSTYGIYEICFMKHPSTPHGKTRVYLHYDIKNEDQSELEGGMNGNSTSLERLVSSLGSGNEDAFALEYSDKKVEAHQMKHACAPLYLDENSKVAIISCDQVGSYLLSATLDLKQGGKCCLAFKAWDSASVLGFTPIEIHIDGGERTVTQDGKFRYLLPFLEEPAGEPGFMIDSLGTCVALLIETDVLIWKILKKELNILSLQLSHSLKLKPNHQGLDLCLLRFNDFWGTYDLEHPLSGNVNDDS